MEKLRYKTASTYKSTNAGKEKSTGKSVTVPGQSYTVAELLQKHIQGNLPDIAREGYFEEDPSFDNIDPTQKPDFDLVDATLLLHETKAKIKEQEALIKQKVEDKKAKNKRAINEDVDSEKSEEKTEVKSDQSELKTDGKKSDESKSA